MSNKYKRIITLCVIKVMNHFQILLIYFEISFLPYHCLKQVPLIRLYLIRQNCKYVNVRTLSLSTVGTVARFKKFCADRNTFISRILQKIFLSTQ